jgi:hypothetical protein
MSQQQSWMPTLMTCRGCKNWDQKDSGTVKVDVGALHARDKENATAAHPNIAKDAQEKANSAIKAEEEKVEKARQQQEWEAKQAELRRQEEERKVMELRVKEEQERLKAEQQRQEAEHRQLMMEEMQRREEELELQKKKEQERKLAEEAKENARKLQEEADQKKIHAWLQANGFKEINQLVRKRLSKVAPLQCAIDQKNIEMMMLLLQHGADASKVNGKNESAVTVAQKMNKKGSHAAVVQALTAYLK